jgi:3-methyladenine DNA glycosylase/8-oxoguanine DNA glycosylase
VVALAVLALVEPVPSRSESGTVSAMIELTVERPFDLRRTLAPIGLAWAAIDSQGWWRGLRTPEGPATVRIRRVDDRIGVDGWGAGSRWVLDRAEALTGVADDDSSFPASAHPVVAELHRRHRGLHIASTGLVFEALLHAIVGQKVTGKEAARSLRGLGEMFSDAAPGPRPGMVLPPDPDRLAVAPYHRFHELGLEKRRADLIRRVAADSRRIDLLGRATAAEAAGALQRYPGVGPWTVAETIVVSHGHADAVSVGDFHLKHLVAWHLAREERGTDERMLELLEPFRPHRARAVRLIELAGPYPRRGPRKPLRSFAGF